MVRDESPERAAEAGKKSVAKSLLRCRARLARAQAEEEKKMMTTATCRCATARWAAPPAPTVSTKFAARHPTKDILSELLEDIQAPGTLSRELQSALQKSGESI
jgi:hypothetical protein